MLNHVICWITLSHVTKTHDDKLSLQPCFPKTTYEREVSHKTMNKMEIDITHPLEKCSKFVVTFQALQPIYHICVHIYSPFQTCHIFGNLVPNAWLYFAVSLNLVSSSAPSLNNRHPWWCFFKVVLLVYLINRNYQLINYQLKHRHLVTAWATLIMFFRKI